MSKLEPHPLSKLFPQILPEDFDKLAGDIKLHGLHHPIVLYQGKILDGNNRYRACEDAKIAPKFTDFTGDAAAARNYVISANIHRRHLTAEKRREIIAELLKADPTQSNRQVAEQAKASDVTVFYPTGQSVQLLPTPGAQRQPTGADGKTRRDERRKCPEVGSLLSRQRP